MSVADANQGFTLLELLITILITAVLAGLAVPSFRDQVERRRLIRVSEAVYTDLQFARTEAIKRHTGLFIIFDPMTWCYGINGTNSCDCQLTDPNAAAACILRSNDTPVLKTTSGSSFPSTTVNAITFSGNRIGFDGIRGIATGGGGSITFTTSRGFTLRIIVSTLGRVRICSPDDSVYGYPAC